MSIDKYHIVHFIGVGGIGMSALARWFVRRGASVTGYDRTKTALTRQLENEGIPVHDRDELALVPSEMKNDPTAGLVVYTPAIPDTHKQLSYFRENGYRVMKRSEVLGEITANLFTIAVAGTHGKTTTSSMIAHILKYSDRDMVAFLGGIMQQYETNLLTGGGGSEKPAAVVEADEYDRSFLRLFPDVSVVTSMEPDHLDVYLERDKLQDSFRAFIGNTHDDGLVLLNEKVVAQAGSPAVSWRDYGLDMGRCRACNIRIVDGLHVFDYRDGAGTVAGIRMQVPGHHNVENAVAAIAVCRHLGVDARVIAAAMADYRGVKRRFEYVLKKHVVYIDDYAHHPTEIRALIRSVRALYPKKRITVVFQPHLYSRTRDFAGGFAESLDLADEVILMNIYPAREEPIEGIDSGLIYRRMQCENKSICEDEQLLKRLSGMRLEVLLTVGAGDIDRFVTPIKSMLQKQYDDAA